MGWKVPKVQQTFKMFTNILPNGSKVVLLFLDLFENRFSCSVKGFPKTPLTNGSTKSYIRTVKNIYQNQKLFCDEKGLTTRTVVLIVAVRGIAIIFHIFCEFSNVIVSEFHHVVQLFLNFTMLCNCFFDFTMLCKCLWISPCCAIISEFHHVVHFSTHYYNWTL